MPSKSKSDAEKHATESLHDLRVLRIGFLLLENFSLIALGTAVDPLRIANMLVERTVYEYELIGTSGDIVRSSDGIRVVPDKSMAEASDFDAVFVVGPNPIPRRGIGGIMDWLGSVNLSRLSRKDGKKKRPSEGAGRISGDPGELAPGNKSPFELFPIE